MLSKVTQNSSSTVTPLHSPNSNDKVIDMSLDELFDARKKIDRQANQLKVKTTNEFVCSLLRKLMALSPEDKRANLLQRIKELKKNRYIL